MRETEPVYVIGVTCRGVMEVCGNPGTNDVDVQMIVYLNCKLLTCLIVLSSAHILLFK